MRLLRNAVQSVSDQTYRPLEIVIVDDGSPTPVSVEPQGEVGVTLARHPVRMGPGAARNTGMALARGEFIAFLDDDDEMAPERIAVAVAGIGQNRMHACATSENQEAYVGDRRADLLHGATPSVTQVLFRRGDLLQFDPTLRLGEDVEWWIRMADRADFAWSDYVGVLITNHDDARPAVFNSTHADCREQILRRHWNVLDRQARIRQLAKVASLNLLAGRFGRAALFAIRVLALQPTRRAAATLAKALVRLPR